MAVPLRYVGEPFYKGRAWWREGKTRPYRVYDRLDTTLEHRAECDRHCDACRDLVPHSKRYHLEAVYAGRREAVCVPHRQQLVRTRGA
jgi:hypothetical protein